MRSISELKVREYEQGKEVDFKIIQLTAAYLTSVVENPDSLAVDASYWQQLAEIIATADCLQYIHRVRLVKISDQVTGLIADVQLNYAIVAQDRFLPESELYYVLERLQAIFEAFGAVVPGVTNRLVLPLDGLIEACHAMEVFPDQVMEKYWAQDILRRQAQGQLALEEDEELTYHDFLSVMLGRRRQKVYLLMYDITDGRAHSWLWLLGPQFRAFWHTGVMVEFVEKPAEFWYGGKVFCSTPCTTPFGQPIERRFMGYTYKSREEVIHHIGIDLAHEFHKNAYDALTHNCNHFSDKLMMYLTNEHLPEEILKQPELVLNSPAVQLARPFLNRWLGEFHAKGEVASEHPMELIQADLGPSALVSFSRREGGLGLIGCLAFMI
eukprot:s9832_g1.t1